MAGRRSVWSDPRLVERAGRFVTAADEVWRLQRGKDVECLWFQRAVNGGEPITDGGSRQGIWVMTAGGRLLSRVNSTSADVVLATLEAGLAAWDELGEDERRLDPARAPVPRHRWEQSEPPGGLVLERIVRELQDTAVSAAPVSADPLTVVPGSGAPGRKGPWNRDFAWFSLEEVAALLPEDAAPGRRYELPPGFALRLARFHLVDNARGQTLPYAPSEVLEARLAAEVLSRQGSRLHLRLEGATRARADGPWLLGDNLWKPRDEEARGIETRLVGRAVLDLAAARFDELELVALASRWGRTTFNGRRRDDSPGLLGFWLGLAAPEPRIAPTFVAVYDADWIARPPE